MKKPYLYRIAVKDEKGSYTKLVNNVMYYNTILAEHVKTLETGHKVMKAIPGTEQLSVCPNYKLEDIILETEDCVTITLH